MALEQKYLNVTTRQEGYIQVLMHITDPDIHINSVSSDDVLSFSNINSIKDIKRYTNTTIATLEENLWILNGGFVNATTGRVYDGYISNSISDENGDFTNNPTIEVELSNSSNVKNFSIMLNSAVRSGYPKQIKVTYFNNSSQIGLITKTISEETNLPNLLFETNLENVTNLTIEFIGTLSPHRRIRVSSLIFGKVILLTQDQLLNTDYFDKCSYVPDTIPSRTFSFTMENYDKRFNVDNPNNEFLNLDNSTIVLIRNGYNIYGYDEDNNIFDNPNRIQDVSWDDWKELRLLNIITNEDNTATFECGSVLDMAEDVYTQEIFNGPRTVEYIINSQLLPFMGLSIGTIIFSSDDNGVSYGNYTINTVLPEIPVREIIQLLAFSVGATLLIKDDGTIKFANLDIDNPSSFTNHHEFNYFDFESVPSAEQLPATDNISLPKYNATIDTSEGVQQIQTCEVSSINVEVSYSECQPTGTMISPDDTSGGTVQASTLYTHRGILTMNLPDRTKVIILGYPIHVIQSQDRSITTGTLIIDTQLMASDENNVIKNKYKKWYSKQFKYKMNTRGEPLVDAGDYTIIQTPFTQQLNGYVLQNHITFDGAFSGDMEVIAL